MIKFSDEQFILQTHHFKIYLNFQLGHFVKIITSFQKLQFDGLKANTYIKNKKSLSSEKFLKYCHK